MRRALSELKVLTKIAQRRNISYVVHIDLRGSPLQSMKEKIFDNWFCFYLHEQRVLAEVILLILQNRHFQEWQETFINFHRSNTANSS